MKKILFIFLFICTATISDASEIEMTTYPGKDTYQEVDSRRDSIGNAEKIRLIPFSGDTEESEESTFYKKFIHDEIKEASISGKPMSYELFRKGKYFYIASIHTIPPTPTEQVRTYTIFFRNDKDTNLVVKVTLHANEHGELTVTKRDRVTSPFPILQTNGLLCWKKKDSWQNVLPCRMF